MCPVKVGYVRKVMKNDSLMNKAVIFLMEGFQPPFIFTLIRKTYLCVRDMLLRD